MRNLITLSLSVLVTACATISADRTETAKQQVAEATAAWVARIIAVIRDASRRCMTPKLCSGEREQKQLLQAQLRLLITLRMPARPPKRELLSANSIFGSMAMWQ